MTVEQSTQTSRPWIIGAYALYPKGEWDELAESEILAACKSLPGFTGWEVPFDGQLHPHEDWFLDKVGSRAQLVLSLIPGVVSRIAVDPAFGLASTDDEARLRALRFVREARDAARRTNDRLGRQAVTALELHSSPRADIGASREALERSLQEVTSWQWDGASLLLEHCDALMPSWKPAKGYLSLDDELLALEKVNRGAASPVRCLINWGRSAIEGHDVSTPVAHVERARSAGLLGGLMFSGCSDNPASRGGPWADFHLPPVAALADGEYSLLDATSASATTTAAGDLASLTVLGMKIGAGPDTSLARRLEILLRSSAALNPISRV